MLTCSPGARHCSERFTQTPAFNYHGIPMPQTSVLSLWQEGKPRHPKHTSNGDWQSWVCVWTVTAEPVLLPPSWTSRTTLVLHMHTCKMRGRGRSRSVRCWWDPVPGNCPPHCRGSRWTETRAESRCSRSSGCPAAVRVLPPRDGVVAGHSAGPCLGAACDPELSGCPYRGAPVHLVP